MIEHAAAAPGRSWSRRGDRRRGFEEFLAYVAAGLHGPRSGGLLRERFEDGLRRLVAARAVAIREGEEAELPAGESPTRVRTDVPRASTTLVRIEAVPESVAPFDEWDQQNLRAARYVAALVLEVDDARRRGVFHPGVPQATADDTPVLVGSSDGIRSVRDRIVRVAATDFTVLIEGESGTGKELVARQIHAFSRRRRGPFVAVNCAALVESLLEAELFGIEDRTATGVRGRRGKFEHADQGTLFLDEVSDLSMSAQAKLLRAIQEMSVERVGGQGTRRVDVRIVVATNRRLLDLVERGHFRLDLFYRLNGVEIGVLPLRERRDDIIELAQVFLDRHRHMRLLSLSPAARDALLLYRWPGNVRELERVIERAVALADSDHVTLDDLPPALVGDYADTLGTSTACGETMRAWGSRYARLVLERCENNKRRACATLGISYHTLQAYLRYRPPAESGKRTRRKPLRTPGTAATEADRPRAGGDREAAVS